MLTIALPEEANLRFDDQRADIIAVIPPELRAHKPQGSRQTFVYIPRYRNSRFGLCTQTGPQRFVLRPAYRKQDLYGVLLTRDCPPRIQVSETKGVKETFFVLLIFRGSCRRCSCTARRTRMPMNDLPLLPALLQYRRAKAAPINVACPDVGGNGVFKRSPGG